MVKQKSVRIDGSEIFPFENFGLSKSDIKRQGSRITFPAELAPYLKLCVLPLNQRIQQADRIYRYRKSLQKNNGSKSTRKEKR
jgi:hypothetical protein